MLTVRDIGRALAARLVANNGCLHSSPFDTREEGFIGE